MERQIFSVPICVRDLYIYVCSSPGCDHSESLGGAGYCSGAAQVGLKGGIPETKYGSGAAQVGPMGELLQNLFIPSCKETWIRLKDHRFYILAAHALVGSHNLKCSQL